jgi:hypothetical protein
MAQTGSGTISGTLPGDREILITRRLNAPRHLVYKAWTNPSSSKSGGDGVTAVAPPGP